MLQTLQPLVDIAGAKIQQVGLNELNYTQEIAAAMRKLDQMLVPLFSFLIFFNISKFCF